MNGIRNCKLTTIHALVVFILLLISVASSSNNKRSASTANLPNYSEFRPGLRTQTKLKNAAISGTLSSSETGIAAGINEEYLLSSLGLDCDLITLSINNANFKDLQEFLGKFSSSDFFKTILFHYIEKKDYQSIEIISGIANELVEDIDTKREIFDKVLGLNDDFKALSHLISGGIDPSTYSYEVASIPRIVIEKNNHTLLNLLMDEYVDLLINASNEPSLTANSDEKNYLPICYANTMETLDIFLEGMKLFLDKNTLRNIFFGFVLLRKISFAHRVISMRTRVYLLRIVPDDIPIYRHRITVPRAAVLDYFYSLVSDEDNSLHWYSAFPDFTITFANEIGTDCGGLYNEFLSILIDELFIIDSTTSIFFSNGPIFTQIDSESGLMAPNMLYPEEIIKFAGSILALAFLKNLPVKSRFIPFVYKSLYEKQVDFEDLEEHDPVAHRHLSFLLSEEANFEELDLEFFSSVGLNATADNVPFYIDDQIYRICELPFQSHVNALVYGFYSILNSRMLSDYLSLEEFQLIFHGRASVDVDDFRNSVDFSDLDETTKEWMIQIFSEMNNEERLKLVRFITGFNSIPYNGLSGFKHKIKISLNRTSEDDNSDSDNSDNDDSDSDSDSDSNDNDNDNDNSDSNNDIECNNANNDNDVPVIDRIKTPRRLPTAQTCFSTFVIPICKSMQDLRERIVQAINLCGTFEVC